jgi:hypothetical protein
MMSNKIVVSTDSSDILGSNWFQKCVNYLNDAVIVTEAEPTHSPGPSGQTIFFINQPVISPLK